MAISFPIENLCCASGKSAKISNNSQIYVKFNFTFIEAKARYNESRMAKIIALAYCQPIEGSCDL
jgi:hypothetical protein